MKIIRWRGFIAFILIVSLIGLGWFLLIDHLVKKGIETAGTRLNGAKVELAEADLSLSPLGLTLEGLQVADRDEPMKNLFQVKRVAFLMDLGGLFLGKVAVDEMTIDGVQVNRSRSSSGAVRKRAKEKKATPSSKDKESAFALPSLDIPDTNTILESEELETLQVVAALQKEVDEGEAEWKERLEALPGKDKTAGYKKRFNAIKKGLTGGAAVILASIEDASKLKKEIKGDMATLKNAKKELRRETASLKETVRQLKKLPSKDLARLKDKYSLSAGGLANMSLFLFGGEIEKQLRSALGWYEKLKPYIERAVGNETKGPEAQKKERKKGTNVRFREFNPLPDFWIKKIKVTFSHPSGDLAGTISDVTSNQKIIGRPTRYAFSGEKMKSFERLDLEGEFSTLGEGGAVNKATLKVSGYGLDNLALSKSADFPVAINQATADYTLGSLISAGGFHADFEGAFSGVTIESGRKEGGGRLVRALSSSLSEINAFSITGRVSGKPEDYNITLRSDIDELLQKAVGDTVKKERARFEEEMKRKLEAKVREPLDKLNRKMGGFADIDKLMASGFKDLGSLEKMIGKQKEEAEKKMKNKLKEKAGSKLKDLKKKFKLPF